MSDNSTDSKRGGFGFNTPFEEQIKYLQQKLRLPTERWDDITGRAHDRAFIVAGAAKADLLADLHAELVKRATDGKGLQAFRKEFKGIVAKHGWTGWTGEGTKEGEAWRTRIIYQTNMATSYAAGRYQQMSDPEVLKLHPYWRYIHSDGVLNPRQQHLNWHGLTLLASHPFWQTHFAPNGFGCQCRITSVTRREGEASARAGLGEPPDGWDKIDGKTGEQEGIGKGFGYAPGANVKSSLQSLVDDKLMKLSPELALALQQEAATVLGAQKPIEAVIKAAQITTQSAQSVFELAKTDAVEKTFSATDAVEFFQGLVSGERPIAVAPTDIKKFLDASSDVVLLSKDTAKKQYREHPEMSVEDYRRIQAMLDQGEVLSDKGLHLGIIQDQGNWYYAVLKATKTGKAIYLLSFRRSNPVDIGVIRERSKLVRPAK